MNGLSTPTGRAGHYDWIKVNGAETTLEVLIRKVSDHIGVSSLKYLRTQGKLKQKQR